MRGRLKLPVSTHRWSASSVPGVAPEVRHQPRPDALPPMARVDIEVRNHKPAVPLLEVGTCNCHRLSRSGGQQSNVPAFDDVGKRKSLRDRRFEGETAELKTIVPGHHQKSFPG